MIRSITVTNYLGESMKIDLTRPDKTGFIVENITGIGPGKSEINVTEMSTTDGGKFNSARLPKRNIVISLRYYHWMKRSIEDSRQLTYRYFPIKRKLTLKIETDNRTTEIEGYVESNEPNIFSKEEGADISIICPEPYLYSAGTGGITTTIFSGTYPKFKFPFSNNVDREYELPHSPGPNYIVTYRYSKNANGSNSTEYQMPDSKYVGVGYMPREIVEHENLLLNTNKNNQIPTFKDSGTGVTSSKLSMSWVDDYKYKVTSEDSNDPYYRPVPVYRDLNPYGGPFVLSFMYQTSPTRNSRARTKIGASGISIYTAIPKDTVGKLIVPVVSNDGDYSSTYISLDPGVQGSGSTSVVGEYIIMWDLKLEPGTEATPWTPAPSDWLSDPTNFTWQPIQIIPPKLLMGDIQNKAENLIVYKGDWDTGIVIKIHAIGPVTQITIHNVTTREQMRIDTQKIENMTGAGVSSGDDIIITTITGNKSIVLIRGGVEINILNCLDRNSDWLKLIKGDNIIAYTAETGSTNLQFLIENKTIYEGV